MNVLVFDIQTIADLDTARKMYRLDDLSDKDVANVMLHKQRQGKGNDDMPLHLQKIVALSVVLRSADTLSICTLGTEDDAEQTLLQQFYAMNERHLPKLVCWNGQSKVYPVLHYRTLLHSINASVYWQQEMNSSLTRRHVDLQTMISGTQSNNETQLNDLVALLELPVGLGANQLDCLDEYLSGRLSRIRDRSEVDAVNAYLIYLRFELIRGHISHSVYEHECNVVRKTLQHEMKPHLNQFLAQWQA